MIEVASGNEYTPPVAPVVNRRRDLSLEGRNAVITGATSGIGRETALALARAGANVAINGRRGELLDELAQEITQTTDRKVLTFPGDISQSATSSEMASTVKKEWEGLHIWVNNAGISEPADPIRASDDHISKIIQI